MIADTYIIAHSETSDQNSESDVKTTRRERIVSHLNARYEALVVNDDEEAEDILNEHLSSQIQIRSNLSFNTLLHLSEEDIDMVFTYDPTLARLIVKDLIRCNRKACRELVTCSKDKTKMDKDAFRLEHILRKTVADLERRKLDLEISLKQRKLELEELEIKTSSQKDENSRLQTKLVQARTHLIGAGIFSGPH